MNDSKIAAKLRAQLKRFLGELLVGLHRHALVSCMLYFHSIVEGCMSAHNPMLIP